MAGLGERSVVYRVFGGQTHGKEATWKTQVSWQDNIKVVQQEVGWGGMDWIVLAQDRDRWQPVVNAVMNLDVPYVPYSAGSFLIS